MTIEGRSINLIIEYRSVLKSLSPMIIHTLEIYKENMVCDQLHNENHEFMINEIYFQFCLQLIQINANIRI